jgi:PIN domain
MGQALLLGARHTWGAGSVCPKPGNSLRLTRQLRPPHGPGLIGDIDTLIAATALKRGLTVVTTDGDFERVPQLKVMLMTLRA